MEFDFILAAVVTSLILIVLADPVAHNTCVVAGWFGAHLSGCVR